MKNGVKQFTDQLIADNKEFIGQERICNYLISEAENIEYGFQEYMSDEEIYKCDIDGFQEAIEEEIKMFLKACYNYCINE